MTTVHNSLIAYRTGYWSGSPIDKTPTPSKRSSFFVNSISKSFRIKPYQVQIIYEVVKSVIDIIHDLKCMERRIHATSTGKMNEQSNNFTLLNIKLSSDTVRPKTGTRSHHRLGYASLLKRIINASIPVAIVP
ncbi:hypothetical protein P5673_000093 [Acropora cervicornis]|uniref:Uncharacterized protein n=1 Tax=Acropora cervicornis TaxID=6130 RepID=A0AAD9R6D0_ACRCE|nr:hypothetical protein P5673_000093 [Acropora cervicornis]